MRQQLLRVTFLLSLAALLPMPRARAASKEMVELQTQVQQLQDTLTQMKQANDERLGVIINLVQQNTDNFNKMTATITQLQQALSAQNEAGGGKIDQISGQLQSLNDSVDELKTRIGKLDSAIQSVQSQLQNTPSNVPAGGNPGAQPPPGMAANQQAAPNGDGTAPAPLAAQAPPLQQAYQSALRDYNAGKYAVAASEFGDVVHYYPQDDLAGNSQFYLGEIAYRQGKFADAVKAYDAVLEQFPGNNKAPAAQLRKGESLIAINQRDAGIRELRSLIQRYPMTPEAQEGRSKLNGMGIRINPPAAPGKPNAYAQ